MSNLNFMDALDTKTDDIERPPLMPAGTYRWQVTKQPSFETVGDGRFDTVDFFLQCIEAQDDVDEESLAPFADNLTNQTQRLRFMFDKNDPVRFDQSKYRLKVFCEEHLGAEGDTLKELLANTVNCQCLGSIRWRQDKNDPDIQYAEIGKTFPVA